MKYFLIPVFVIFAAGIVFAQNDMQVVAEVKLLRRQPIMVKQLKNEVDNIEKATGKKLTVAQRREILDSLINQSLAIQAAERDKILVTDAEINQKLSELRNQLAAGLGHNPTDAEFANAIREETGLEMPAFRDQYKKTMTVQKYLLSKKGNLLQSIKPPADDEINDFYKKNASEFVQPETIKFSAVIFPFKNDSEKASARNDAAKMLKEIGGNASTFDEKVLSGRLSNSSYVSTEGTFLPRNTPGVSDSFIKTAFSLEQGKVSGVLDAPSERAQGFYIIKVTDKYPMKTLKLDDILLNVPPEVQMQFQGRPVTVRMYIQLLLGQQKQQDIFIKAQKELIDDLRKEGQITIDDKFLNY
ncbi:MAG: peptidyl-prolyl cis-trans isomerase [Spirochaetaceae bacterium]|jgi:parvulin-like peptidyl-prolyl isomerase|nr:peptidyl-prolyl cis-trans isomerase [Spirochaetaceae bacterium]